jgi:hypothetical protein
MKHIASILLIITSSLCFGQKSSDPFYVAPDDDNAPIVNFVKAHIYKKVGNGICMSLVTEAMKQKYPNWDYRTLYNKDSLISHEVYLDKVKPGDIIHMEWPDKEYGHIGIVTFVKGNIIWYANQNSGDKEIEMKKVMDQGTMADVYWNSHVAYEMVDVSKMGNMEIWLFHF